MTTIASHVREMEQVARGAASARARSPGGAVVAALYQRPPQCGHSEPAGTERAPGLRRAGRSPARRNTNTLRRRLPARRVRPAPTSLAGQPARVTQCPRSRGDAVSRRRDPRGRSARGSRLWRRVAPAGTAGRVRRQRIAAGAPPWGELLDCSPPAETRNRSSVVRCKGVREPTRALIRSACRARCRQMLHALQHLSQQLLHRGPDSVPRKAARLPWRFVLQG